MADREDRQIRSNVGKTQDTSALGESFITVDFAGRANSNLDDLLGPPSGTIVMDSVSISPQELINAVPFSEGTLTDGQGNEIRFPALDMDSLPPLGNKPEH